MAFCPFPVGFLFHFLINSFLKTVPPFDGLCTVTQLFYAEIKARDVEVRRDREVLQGV